MENKVSLLLLFLLLFFQSFAQPKELILSNGSTETLQHAITQLNGFGIINIKGELKIDFSITVPYGITLLVTKEGSFNIANHRTLSINGILKAGSFGIFNKSVKFSESSVSEIKVEWFGSSDVAVNNALMSASEIPVRIVKDVVVTNTIWIGSKQTLIIDEGVKLLPTNEMIGKAVISNKNKSDTNITIHGGIIDGTGADRVAYDAVLFNTVSSSSITNLSCLNVHITASKDTGNIRLNNCNYVSLENCNVTGTWKMGIFVLNGSCNNIIGGTFFDTHDSAIGVVNSPGTVIDGLYVNNCGTSDGSNMSLNAEKLLVINNTSINAGGKRNGNGITLGHDGAPASYSVCSNNIISNNAAKGIFIQGENTKNVLVLENNITGNGIDSEGVNSGGIAVYSGSKGHLISNNHIRGNRLGVSLHKTSQNVLIHNNEITGSKLFGIRNDGENIIIRENLLSNNNNIHIGKNSKHVVLSDNIMKSE